MWLEQAAAAAAAAAMLSAERDPLEAVEAGGAALRTLALAAVVLALPVRPPERRARRYGGVRAAGEVVPVHLERNSCILVGQRGNILSTRHLYSSCTSNATPTAASALRVACPQPAGTNTTSPARCVHRSGGGGRAPPSRAAAVRVLRLLPLLPLLRLRLLSLVLAASATTRVRRACVRAGGSFEESEAATDSHASAVTW